MFVNINGPKAGATEVHVTLMEMEVALGLTVARAILKK